MTFAWSLLSRPAGSQAELSGAATAYPSFVPDQIGPYVAQLIVSDGTLASAPDTVTIEALRWNQPPVIISAPVTTATAGQPYGYDVEATDPDAGDVLTYSLTAQPRGWPLTRPLA